MPTMQPKKAYKQPGPGEELIFRTINGKVVPMIVKVGK